MRRRIIMKIDIHQAIIAIVEAMLPRFTKDKLLFISVRCNYDFYEEGVHIEHPAFTVNFIFHRPSNYTKVLFQVLDRVFISPYDLTAMQLSSDHDSCWRSDGISSVLSKIHFEHCDTLKAEIARKKRSKKYADSFHREIYKSYPSFATIERLELIDGTVIRSEYEERNFVLKYDEEKKFYEFYSKKGE
jgi:hypothetical protein